MTTELKDAAAEPESLAASPGPAHATFAHSALSVSQKLEQRKPLAPTPGILNRSVE